MPRRSATIARTLSSAAASDPCPFPDAASAWFGSLRMLPASQGRPRAARTSRAETVLRTVERLRREGRLAAAHLGVLTHYGLQMLPPAADAERHRRLWDEALARLAGPLRRLGIVA